jgi:hypothetical protein
MSGAQKAKLKRLQFLIINQWVAHPGLACFSAPPSSKSSHDIHTALAVFPRRHENPCHQTASI